MKCPPSLGWQGEKSGILSTLQDSSFIVPHASAINTLACYFSGEVSTSKRGNQDPVNLKAGTQLSSSITLQHD